LKGDIMAGIFSGIISFLIVFVLTPYVTSIPTTPNAMIIKIVVFVVFWIFLGKAFGGKS